MEYRIERDSMGEMQVPADRYWLLRLREVIRISRLVSRRCQLKLYMHLVS